jgi:hypothetical protein
MRSLSVPKRAVTYTDPSRPKLSEQDIEESFKRCATRAAHVKSVIASPAPEVVERLKAIDHVALCMDSLGFSLADGSVSVPASHDYLRDLTRPNTDPYREHCRQVTRLRGGDAYQQCLAR